MRDSNFENAPDFSMKELGRLEMGSSSKKRNRDAQSAAYKASPHELGALQKCLERLQEKSSVRLTVVGDATGAMIVKPDHPDKVVGQVLLMEALGTADPDFAHGILRQLVNAGSQGQADEGGINFMLSVIKGIAPKDQLETMLASQMAAVHMATMTLARRLAHVENIPQQDSAERAFNKLTRTFVAQMDALKRYRTGGEQKVTVQHVSVGEGGRAIVGNVTQAPRETAPENKAAAAPALTHAESPPMAIVEERSNEPAPAPALVRRKRDT